jgi:selT/selW/selH-like putative selenoprotein
MDEIDSMPKLEITGDNYEVGGQKALLGSIIGYIRTAFFIMLFVGDNFFQPFGGLNAMPSAVKDIYRNINENKIQYGLMVFFFGTMLQNSLTQSGAFEIYINGNLEFSKLDSGRMPNLHDVNDILSRYNINL